jgi:nucleotide-binding universal stress UspA family protein
MVGGEGLMRVLVWIVQDTWRAPVDAARALAPADAEVTLLHVAPAEVESVAAGARHGLLGRPRRGPPAPPVREISDAAAAALLDEARVRLGRDAARDARRGRVEREVVDAARGADLLVAARDTARDHAGPHSLGPDTRFVVDHAPCDVLLVWPDGAASPHH